jgi:hypothetical protein
MPYAYTSLKKLKITNSLLITYYSSETRQRAEGRREKNFACF